MAKVPVPFMRTEWNYDRDEASAASALKCEDPSLAVQDAAEETDINTIVRRFGITGQLPQNVRAPQYGDFTEVTDYQTAMNAVIAADEAFMAMPADVRKRFQNSPQLFLEFVGDESNREEAKRMGLLVPEPAPVEPVAVRVVVDKETGELK